MFPMTHSFDGGSKPNNYNEAIYHIPQVPINLVILILKAVDYEKEGSNTLQPNTICQIRKKIEEGKKVKGSKTLQSKCQCGHYKLRVLLFIYLFISKQVFSMHP